MPGGGDRSWYVIFHEACFHIYLITFVIAVVFCGRFLTTATIKIMLKLIRLSI